MILEPLVSRIVRCVIVKHEFKSPCFYFDKELTEAQNTGPSVDFLRKKCMRSFRLIPMFGRVRTGQTSQKGTPIGPGDNDVHWDLRQTRRNFQQRA